MKKLIPLLILLSMICSCADTPESGKVPAPVFINDAQTTQERALDINVDITDSNNSRKEEARVMYYTEFPLISSFIPNGARIGEEIRSDIATDSISLSVTKVGNIIIYEGQTDDDIYVRITLDTETNTFDYKQVAIADVTLMTSGPSTEDTVTSNLKYSFITEGTDMKVHEDGGIEGAVRVLYFRKNDEKTNPERMIDVEMLKEEMYSDGNIHAIAMLGNYQMNESATIVNEIPSLTEMKEMSIDSFESQLSKANPNICLYFHNENGFDSAKLENDSDPDDYTEKLTFLQNKANELFGEGKWELSIQE